MTATNKKKFLIVTHSFPPMGGGGVQRIVKFARYLKELDWEATVICPAMESYSWTDEERLEEIASINVIRVPINLLKGGVLGKVQRKLRRIDPFIDWSQSVIRNLREFDFSCYDIIFTSGPPHSVHYIGKHIKNSTPLKWVADFRDHFTLGPEYKPVSPFHAWYNTHFEKKIYKEADAIITNTGINKEEVLKNFKIETENKIFTIYNGYDKEDLKTNPATIVDWDTSKLHLLYLGGLRGDHIDGVFYHTVKKALEKQPSLRAKLSLHIIGDISRKGNLLKELGIEEIFCIRSYLPYDEVGAYLDKADAGLSWQRDRKAYRGTIAGKIFDYIGKALPIFSLGQDDGAIAKILDEFGIGLSASPADLESAGDQFIRFCQDLEEGKFQYSESIRKVLNERFNRKNQARQLKDIFDHLVSD